MLISELIQLLYDFKVSFGDIELPKNLTVDEIEAYLDVLYDEEF